MEINMFEMFTKIRQFFYLTQEEIKELPLSEKYDGLAHCMRNNDEKGAGVYLHEIVVEKADTLMAEYEEKEKGKKKKKKKKK